MLGHLVLLYELNELLKTSCRHTPRVVRRASGGGFFFFRSFLLGFSLKPCVVVPVDLYYNICCLYNLYSLRFMAFPTSNLLLTCKARNLCW